MVGFEKTHPADRDAAAGQVQVRHPSGSVVTVGPQRAALFVEQRGYTYVEEVAQDESGSDGESVESPDEAGASGDERS